MTAEFASRGTAVEAVRSLEVVENSNDGVAVLDHDWRYLYVNGRGEEMARVPRDRLLGRVLWELFPEAEAGATAVHFRRTMRDRVPTRFEEFYAPYNLWVEVHAYPTPEGLAMLVRDISEQKRAEQRLRESEERYRRLFEATSDGILIVNEQGCYVDVNESYCRILKAPRERLIGAHFADFIPPERLAQAERAFEELRAGGPTPVDFPLRALDGEIVELAWNSYSHYLPGLYFCCCREIGGQKKAEQERALLLEREREARETAELLNTVGPMLLAELEQEKLVQSVVDLATRATGAEVGCFFQSALNGERQVVLRCTVAGPRREEFSGAEPGHGIFASTLRGQGVVRAGDLSKKRETVLHFKTAKGPLPVRSALAVPLVSRSGDVLGGLFFGHSAPHRFSERQESMVAGIAAQAAIALDNARLFEQAQWVQSELKKSNEELRRANKDLESFAYSASHDLQEPLRNVSLSAQLLQRLLANAAVPEETGKFMEGILKGAKRMENLVRDLLTYTRATQFNEGPYAEVNATGTLAGVLLNLRNRIDQTGATITSADLPVISMHQVHLIQLFQNLISNALKYRSKENPRVHITATRQQGWWVFSVADNGIGIDPRYGTQIFGLFKRLHTREEYPGSGIGLAICQRIVEQYGGRIWLERSAPGEGSVFCFSLPDR
jgi:PAS domain S-box-containing protein